MKNPIQIPAEHITQQQRPAQLLNEPQTSFADNRPQTTQFKTLQTMMSNSGRQQQHQFLQAHSIQRKIAVTGGAPGATYEENTNVFDTEEVAAAGNIADYAAQPDNPATNPNKDYAGTNTAGYLLNVSSMNKSGAPADVRQGDIEAVHTVRRYNQGFETANEAKNRLRMVINVNQYDDAKTTDDVRTLLTNAVTTQRGLADITNSAGKVAIIGHLWRHQWKRSDTNALVTVNDVKTEYQTQLAAGKTPEELKAGYGKVKFGFGTMREKTFKHAQTGNFYNQLNSRHLQTFVHLGDGDVIDVKKGADNKGIYDRMDTWRGASAANRNKKLIGGGVEYKGQNQGGDAPNDQGKLVKVLSDIDMNNRDSMATVDGKAPWMTEPNTFIDYTTLAGIHGAWKNQPGFMVDVGSFLSNLVGAGEATFNAQDLSIVSSANTHTVTPTGNARPTVKNFVKEIKKYKDSSFDPMSWSRRVKSTLDMAGAGRTAGEAGKLCLAIMHTKVAAIDNAEAPLQIKNIFIDHGETKNAIAVPKTREEHVALWGEANVAKVESFADQLVIQIKAAWTAYQSM